MNIFGKDKKCVITYETVNNVFAHDLALGIKASADSVLMNTSVS